MNAAEFETFMFGALAEIVDRPLCPEWDRDGWMHDFEVADTFLYPDLTGETFMVPGVSTPVEGGHLNYVAVGMMYAHYSSQRSMAPLSWMVGAWNVKQVVGGEGIRNVNDIQPGLKFAKMGATYYLLNRHRLMAN